MCLWFTFIFLQWTIVEFWLLTCRLVEVRYDAWWDAFGDHRGDSCGEGWGLLVQFSRDYDRAYAFLPQRAPAKVSSELGEFYSDDASRSELPGGRTAGRGGPVGAHGRGNAFAHPQLGCKRGWRTFRVTSTFLWSGPLARPATRGKEAEVSAAWSRRCAACKPARMSQNERPTFYRQELNKTIWEVPERYQNLSPVGSGAYGSVWYVAFCRVFMWSIAQRPNGFRWPRRPVGVVKRRLFCSNVRLHELVFHAKPRRLHSWIFFFFSLVCFFCCCCCVRQGGVWVGINVVFVHISVAV